MKKSGKALSDVLCGFKPYKSITVNHYSLIYDFKMSLINLIFKFTRNDVYEKDFFCWLDAYASIELEQIYFAGIRGKN